MKGIIWYAYDKEKALDKLKSIKETYINASHIDVEKEIHSINDNYIIFNNGDYWRVIKATEASRGYRANLSYISKDIPQDIIHTIIRPITTAIPYCGFNYY